MNRVLSSESSFDDSEGIDNNTMRKMKMKRVQMKLIFSRYLTLRTSSYNRSLRRRENWGYLGRPTRSNCRD